jgi:ubiquinone/menaquinone biosynthesis C-methylase UbiE
MNQFDSKAATWDADPQKADRARRIAQAMVREVPVTPVMNAFEYGCGTGLLGFALQPHVAQVTLADSSPAMLDVLRAKIAATGATNMTPLALDLVNAPLPDARFDLVCTLMTLHHIRDVDGILGRFHALLRSPGVLCVSDLDLEDGSFHGPDADVHRGFDRADLASKLERAGFAEVRVTTAFEIVKETSTGTRAYPVFLAIARKR